MRSALPHDATATPVVGELHMVSARADAVAGHVAGLVPDERATAARRGAPAPRATLVPGDRSTFGPLAGVFRLDGQAKPELLRGPPSDAHDREPARHGALESDRPDRAVGGMGRRGDVARALQRLSDGDREAHLLVDGRHDAEALGAADSRAHDGAQLHGVTPVNTAQRWLVPCHALMRQTEPIGQSLLVVHAALLRGVAPEAQTET